MCYVECHIKQMNLSVETHINWGGGWWVGRASKTMYRSRGMEWSAAEIRTKITIKHPKHRNCIQMSVGGVYIILTSTRFTL